MTNGEHRQLSRLDVSRQVDRISGGSLAARAWCRLEHDRVGHPRLRRQELVWQRFRTVVAGAWCSPACRLYSPPWGIQLNSHEFYARTPLASSWTERSRPDCQSATPYRQTTFNC